MHVVIFVPPNVHSLELAGLTDVFAEANERAARNVYEATLVAQDDNPVRCGSGLRIVPDLAYRFGPDRPDTLLVAGSVGVPDSPDANVVDWLSRVAPRTRRCGSVCTGAFLLGDAGLLVGRRVTTHWQFASLLGGSLPSRTRALASG